MFNLAAYVLQHAKARAAHPALQVLGGETLDYATLAARIRGTATGLRDLGLAPGDRLLMRLGNRPDFPITYLAAITAGLVPVPTSAQLTQAEVTKIAHEVAPKLIVHASGIALPAGDWPLLDAARLADMAVGLSSPSPLRR